MRALKTTGVLAAAAAVLMTGAAAQAAVGDAFGMGVASTAAKAETTTTNVQAIRPAVRDAVKQLIVTKGPKPDEVIAGIDAVFAACRPADGSPALTGWNCPTTPQAYSALMEVRGVVLALLESPAPAAIGQPGSAAFSNFPVTTASGTNYTQLPQD